MDEDFAEFLDDLAMFAKVFAVVAGIGILIWVILS